MGNPKIDLTAREIEVLKLLSRGLNSKEIAEKLFISPNTVEYHRKQLLRKTVSINSAELIGNAFRLGLLSIADDWKMVYSRACSARHTDLIPAHT